MILEKLLVYLKNLIQENRMKKLKNMTIMCENAEEAKEYWYLEQLGKNIIIKSDKELNVYDIPCLIINNTVVLKVEESTTSKDLLGVLKHNGMDAIVLQDTIDILDEDIYYFNNEDDLVDYVIEQNKPFTFIDITAEYLQEWYNEDEEKQTRIKQLYKVSGDNKILLAEVQDTFIF